MLEREPLTVAGPYGLAYDPLSGRWSESADAGVNYMMVGLRD
jgi:2-polyprenyl-6-hydroxyphenyl methylase/3-demethylubiquinone-9 3-methyltransferase